MTDGATAAFTEHRALLFTIAYEITGSTVDAEDVVSECYLRWRAAASDDIANPRAYLARIATRQALNLMRGTNRRRETYVGPWLPEPLLTSPDVADDAVMAESVSMAMLVVLESLSPDERAVFVLREVFAFSHREIADSTGKSEAAVRQILHRARSAVESRRPRFNADPALSSEVLQKFWTATSTGDVQGLMNVLAPDVVLISDGGGKVPAARRPVSGNRDVARLIAGWLNKLDGEVSVEPALVNGVPGLLVKVDRVLDSVGVFDVDGDTISRMYLIRNPDKLVGARATIVLSR
jgi:RNA polymerase sigma-70 factor, ECF subfamily